MDGLSANCDVCVIGSGPGGATAATFIAMQGHRVVLLEKEALPVYKIGESLLPSTIHGICAMLGVSEELKQAQFVRKHGGTFRWGTSAEPWTFSFSESSAFQGPTSYAYQVERLKFDAILLNNASRHGVDVRERHHVVGLVVEDDRIVGVDVRDAGGQALRVRCQYVIDASGHGSNVAHYIGDRVYSEFFRNIAVFAYYHGGGRLPPPRSGNIFCTAFDKGWFWYIPLSDTLTSVGAVIGTEFGALLHQDHESVLTELIAECSPIRDLLGPAMRVVDGPYGEVRVRKDFSYTHTRFWRPGLVLVGDAACFIDPVFSSGVHLATYSALLAARSINSRLAYRLSEERVFAEYETRYRREYGYFHDFLCAFYDVHQDLNSYYWTARKVLHSDEAPAQAFARLVGGAAGESLCHETTGMADARREFERRMKNSSPSADAIAPPGRRAGARFWAELNAESVDVQLRGASLTEPSSEKPLYPGGLIPSADGLHWVEPTVPLTHRTTTRNVVAQPSATRD
jgi:FAD-dependent halogenase